MTKIQNKKQAGFSLLELLLVVGVGALLLLAGIGTYRLVTQGTSANEAVRVLTTLKEKTQRAFQGQSSYGTASADLVPTLVTMRAFPAGVLDDSDTPRHSWGDTIAVTVNADTQMFDITFNNVPDDACVNLGTTFDTDDTDFDSLSVNGGDVTSMDATTLAGVCTAGDNDLVWSFY